ncbi:uncharacterized protein (TIGR03083 family) [Branchiibius hedensis]|uniref:TIGR03083 family protein n=1 Tax=Branchiibius hedensis TaxID=672460 RepID=A0A2Y8ZT01_9MICO|nr:maleylpyruvate isomerase family mycothiol-dependent enzyme [Branchiibius hedensis]PWJ25545.1 uncharacterized protein (TIGR03083 family) [Branchiibius hedensis]SSA34358.1 TIGR03083 family protein [Branchiibius hedensis]
MAIDYVATVREQSGRFLSVLRDTPPTTQVPSCPDWDAADLVWHLGEVQSFWENVVRRDITDEDRAEGVERPERPAEYAGLLAFGEEASAQLVRTLGRYPADTQRYMWAHDPALHTVGYISRRQALEALIHRVDAELTAAVPTAPIDPALAADGVDEVVDVIRGGAIPDWASFTPAADRIVELTATDVPRRWTLQLGRFGGVTPDGVEVNEHGFQRVDASPDVSATVSGTSADLLLWLWNRPAGPVDTAGDPDALRSLDYAVAEDID